MNTTQKSNTAIIAGLVWIGRHMAEILISGVYVCSLFPFFSDFEKPALLAGFLAFSSMIMSYTIEQSGIKKPSTFYNILRLVALIIFVGSVLLVEHNKNIVYAPIDKFFQVYDGSFLGMMLASFVVIIIEDSRHWNGIKKRIEAKKQMAVKSIPESASNLLAYGDIPIRSVDGGRIVGYIDSGEYNIFISKNIRRVVEDEKK